MPKKAELKPIKGEKPDDNLFWIHCPKCRGASNAHKHISPPTCIKCGHVFIIDKPKKNLLKKP